MPLAAANADATTGPTLGGRAARRARQAQFYEEYFRPYDTGYRAPAEGDVKAASRRFRKLAHGPMLRDVQTANRVRAMGGYGTAEDATTKYALGELDKVTATGVPGVPLHHTGDEELGTVKSYYNARLGNPGQAIADVPELAALSKYAREHLGGGLAPDEVATIRAQGQESIEASTAEAKRQAGLNAVRAGYGDPRLGLVAAGRADVARAGSRAALERDIVAQNLARKRDFENLTTSVAGLEGERIGAIERGAGDVANLEEGARRFDVGAEQQRLSDLYTLLAHQGDAAEGRREYDIGLGESKRQARRNARLLRSMLRRAEPSGLEKAGAIISGVNQGLQI